MSNFCLYSPPLKTMCKNIILFINLVILYYGCLQIYNCRQLDEGIINIYTLCKLSVSIIGIKYWTHISDKIPTLFDCNCELNEEAMTPIHR